MFLCEFHRIQQLPQILDNLQKLSKKNNQKRTNREQKKGTACSCNLNFRDDKRLKTNIVTNEQSYDGMRRAQRRGYLVVAVAVWIEGGERRGWDFTQPLFLWVRPCLVIKGDLRWFYLRCTDRAQQGATHTHACTHTCGSRICTVNCSLFSVQVTSWQLQRYLSFVLVDTNF